MVVYTGLIFTFETTQFCCEDIFTQRVEVLSSTTKSKKIEIKGGFYSETDMKTELGYTPNLS